MKSENYDALRQKFVEEASDLLVSLEENLLQLEKVPTDSSLMNEVFRLMHTLKGTSGMFGFEQIGEFTHYLENIYDLARNQQLALTQQVLTCSLAAVDHLRELLVDVELQQPNNKVVHGQLLEQIKNMSTAAEGQSIQAAEAAPPGTLKTFGIYFRPHPGIMGNGTNPLFLLDELAEMGTYWVQPQLDALPGLEEMDPHTAYAFWNIVLATEASEEAVQEVFMFVEDDADLQISLLATQNLLALPDFAAALEQAAAPLGMEQIMELAQSTTAKQLAQQQKKPEAPAIKKAGYGISSIRIAADKLDALMNLVSELITAQARLNLVSDELSDPQLQAVAEDMEKISRQLRDNAFQMCLVPVSSLITRVERLVRDLSNELGKPVELVTEGGTTELDKSVIEGLADPLLHIIRNAMDHGLELPRERTEAGKPEKGKVTLKSYYSGNQVVIEVMDDGRGIDPEKLRKKGIEKGLISGEAQLSKGELLNLIFTPGFSTAQKVTGISGRGVGMDVVKKKITELHGNVYIDSTIGRGTSIVIKLPLSLSIVDGLLVKLANTPFVVPLSSISRIREVTYEALLEAYNDTLIIDGRPMVVLNLRESFGVDGQMPKYAQVIIVQYEKKEVGLAFDAIVGEYQAVLKPLGSMYKKQENFSGATILGDGTVALVLDIGKLVEKLSMAELSKAE